MADLQYSWSYLASILLVVMFTLTGDGVQAKGENNGCSDVKHAYGIKGLGDHEVPQKMISGEHLKVCPQGFTCCTKEMEHKLNLESKQEFEEVVAGKVKNVRQIFITRAAKFDAFFTELLNNARTDLHDMFDRTYGLLYRQNAYVFTDLFDDLRDYYSGGEINLVEALDTFFSTLLQKMFELLNGAFTFDESYLQCVTEHMDELKPFGTVPQKLSIQVKRAFIAARTFVQGLQVGRDVILSVSKLQPTSSCVQANMKMMYCPYCRGLPYTKPCNDYCMNVMKGCLAYHADLNAEWNKYIDALMKVAERLEGPFNIETVVEPIDVKISDAIMNFQDNSEDLSEKVFLGCGQPQQYNRKKREAPEDWNAKYEASQSVRPTTAAGTSLDRLVKDIRKKVDVTKDFWVDLPDSICNDVAAPMNDDVHCWNGIGRSKYMPQVMNDGVVNQINNPEVEVDVRKSNPIINQEILHLKLMTNKLESAYVGRDVDWIDTMDILEEITGSGSAYSGSGSGFEGPSISGGPDDKDDGLTFSQTRSTNHPPEVKTRGPPGNPYEREELYNPNSSSTATYSWTLLVLPLIYLLISLFMCKSC